jgi:hypothetical protein
MNLFTLWKNNGERGSFWAMDKNSRLILVKSLSKCQQLAIVITSEGDWDVEPAFCDERAWRPVGELRASTSDRLGDVAR